jgi:XTP/dITP diphosphohydrolase
MKLFLATGNAHKVSEISRLLAEAGLRVRVCSATEAGGMPPVEETADSFEGNALLKAEALWRQLGEQEWVLADDSGLEVVALEGAPGVRSARYAGPGATDEANRRKLLSELEGVPESGRRGRFVCALALVGPTRREVFAGVCAGTIADVEAGSGGFGYDPLFRPTGSRETFAEMPPADKNRLSHRGKALAQLIAWLRSVAREEA